LRRNRIDLIKTPEIFEREYDGIDFTSYDFIAKDRTTTSTPPTQPPATPTPPLPSPPLRRSTRLKRKPDYLNDYVLYKGSLVKKMKL